MAATAPARQGLSAKFEQEVDPDRALPVAEPKRRADVLMRAHMLRFAALRREPSGGALTVEPGCRRVFDLSHWRSAAGPSE